MNTHVPKQGIAYAPVFNGDTFSEIVCMNIFALLFQFLLCGGATRLKNMIWCKTA